MRMVKAQEIRQSEILHLESEMNNLWGELNTSNIPYSKRIEIEERLGECEEAFKAVMGGQGSIKELENRLHRCDTDLAMATVQQAENELPKTEHTSSCFLALENIKHELKEGHLTPVKARHEVKTVMRHHT